MKALSKFIFSVVVLGFSIASAQVRPLTAEDLKPGDKVARLQAIASGQFEIGEIPKTNGS